MPLGQLSKSSTHLFGIWAAELPSFNTMPTLRTIEEENVISLTLSGLHERVGQELGISDWVTIDQERINTFAACTGDHQWIHVDI